MENRKVRLFWLKLDREFFRRPGVVMLQTLAGGKEMLLFIIKVIVDSLESDGVLEYPDIFDGVSVLAEMHKESREFVICALNAAQSCGLCQVAWEDGQLRRVLIPMVVDLADSVTNGAIEKREERERKQQQKALPGTAPEQKKGKQLSKKDQEAEELFMRLWRQYPRKRGKDKVSMATKRRLLEIGEETCQRFLDRHNAQMAGKDEQYIPYGSSFFNSILWEMIENNEQPAQAPAQAQPVTPDTVRDTYMREGIYNRATNTWDRARFEEVRPKLSPEMAAAIEAEMEAEMD